MWTLCDTENKCLNCATVCTCVSGVLFHVHVLVMVCKSIKACQVISILNGGVKERKVALIKGQETADSVPEKDPSLTSSIYHTAPLSITPRA